MTKKENKQTIENSERVEKKWLEILTILIKYKFADKGTAESTADEIYNLFLEGEEK